ncbi:calcyclin-binding protein-like [Paramacrobiotus metropolitanus]|uniref:calcyclin-binding protein-like n=1 Tax=Paramacrobiotus metropolitanus TaxID=2943436 RepID=UPI002445F5C2|nr:calcyclin-binding protein-like [Paramacrobiotus metropolitanus]
MDPVAESRLDVDELKQLFEKASRPFVKNLLTAEISKLENDINRRAGQGPKKAVSAAPATSRTKISLYGWDQSDKFLTLYISDKLKDIKGIPAENVTSSFSERGAHMEVKGLNGRDYYFDLANLAYAIIPEESTHKLRGDSVVLNLRKKESKTWECVTAAEKQRKDKKAQEKFDMDSDAKSDPSASMMTMMKKMYEEGDDDMKRTISKAWFEASQKQNKGMKPESFGM